MWRPLFGATRYVNTIHIRQQLSKLVKNNYIRFHWESSDSDSYWEMKMFHSEIAGNYHLLVTDFADDDDVEGLEQLWNQNIDRLHRITGM